MKKDELEAENQKLKDKLQQREQDLERYKSELAKTNSTLKEIIAQVRSQLKIAETIHKTLVPTELKHIPGFEFSSKFIPSTLAGSDYFDIFEQLDRFRFNLILSSASSYGLSSLLLTILLRGSATGKGKAKKPRELVRVLIDGLEPSLVQGDTAHLFYGVVDRRSFDLKYCLFGDIHAFHYSAGQGKLDHLAPQGKVISHDNREIKEESLRLNSRDRLVLVSPWATEIVNKDDEKFGPARLYQTLLQVVQDPQSGVHDLRNEVIFQLQRFSDKKSWERDVTVLVVEVKDKVIKLAPR